MKNFARIPFCTTTFCLLFLLAVPVSAFTDNDGDLLPDLWEAHFGINTNSASGVNGADGDPDDDGLSNLAEYRAGYYEINGNIYSNFSLAVSGLYPTNAFSLNASFSDYHYRPVGARVPLGWMFMDGDRIDDSWESVYSNDCSRFVYNGPSLRSNGWSEWDDFQRSYLGVDDHAVKFRLSYFGAVTDGSVTIAGYTDITKAPDVLYVVQSMNGIFTPTNSVSGKVKSTTMYWTAMKGSVWSPGTPFAFFHPAQDYAFGSEKEYRFGPAGLVCRFNLTDYAPWASCIGISGFNSRIAFPAADGQNGKQRVVVIRKTVDGSSYNSDVMLNLIVDGAQTFLHEGHFFSIGDLEIDWRLVDVPTSLDRLTMSYEIYAGFTGNYGLKIATFTNTFDNVRSKATLVSPVGGSIVGARRPIFRWHMPENYSAFSLEVRKGASTGPLYYLSGAVRRPQGDVEGNCVWSAPLYSDRNLSSVTYDSGTNYYWRVSAMNAKFYDAEVDPNWSEWAIFRAEYDNPLLTQGMADIPVIVKYFGAGTNLVSTIRVQIYDNLSFSGIPIAETVVAGDSALSVTNDLVATNTVVAAVPPGNYCVRAYIDSNLNGRQDTWESWGYSGRTLIRILYAQVFSPFLVVIEDTDIDGDGYPDVYEYDKNPGDAAPLLLTGPSRSGRVNPTLSE